jgi:hypothetical protein
MDKMASGYLSEQLPDDRLLEDTVNASMRCRLLNSLKTFVRLGVLDKQDRIFEENDNRSFDTAILARPILSSARPHSSLPKFGLQSSA